MVAGRQDFVLLEKLKGIFFFGIYLFSCIGSYLWHARSSSHRAESFSVVRGLLSCITRTQWLQCTSLAAPGPVGF